MMQVRKAGERGQGEHGWLHARHSFSFGSYYDANRMGFRSLRVINEDRVEGGTGFGMHGHQNMEIFTHILSGSLRHRDSMGHEAAIVPGQIQYMSAGSGVRHSEFNGSPSEEVHLMQVWIEPNRTGTEPRYEDRDFSEALASGNLVLVASPDGAERSFAIHAGARVYAARPEAGNELRHKLEPGRGAYVQVARGRVEVNGHTLEAGDALVAEDERELAIRAVTAGEFLLFDLD